MPDPIYPRPQWLRLRDESFALDLPLAVGIAHDTHREMAERLAEELLAQQGVDAEIVEPAEAGLLLGTLDDPAVVEALRSQQVSVDDQVRQAGGYLLSISHDTVLLAGFDAAGLFYAVQSLLQLVEVEGGRVSFPQVEVQDWPYKAVRGIHVYMPGRDQIPFFKRLLRWLASLKYNTVFLEVSGGMRYDRRPEINVAWEQFCATASAFPGGAWGLQQSQPYMKNSTHTELGGGSFLEKAEVADLIAFARELHVEIIPEVQSLSHAYYLCMAYPEIAERADDPYPDTYCPSNPKSYEVLFDVLEEVIEVFQPRILHIGHDEIYHLGVCPRCEGKSGAELLAFDINRTHEFLASHGVRLGMWGEKLLPVYTAGRPEGGLERNATRRAYVATAEDGTELPRPVHRMLATYEAVDQIPKDVLISDWFWMLEPQSAQFFEKHGFEIVYGNFGDNFGAQIFDRWNERSTSRAILGAEVSTWCEVSEFALGYNGCVFNMLFAAQMLWWANYRDIHRPEVTATIAARMPEARIRLSGSTPPPAPVAEAFQAVKLPADMMTAAPFAADLHMQNVPPFTLADGGAAVSIEEGQSRKVIPIGRLCKQLHLLHTCASEHTRLPTWYLDDPLRFPAADQIAVYRARYTDGQTAEIPIYYGSQVARWDIPYGEHIDAAPYWADPLRAGVDAAGRFVTLYRYTWDNPRPEAEIQELEIDLSAPRAATFWLFAAATA